MDRRRSDSSAGRYHWRSYRDRRRKRSYKIHSGKGCCLRKSLRSKKDNGAKRIEGFYAIDITMISGRDDTAEKEIAVHIQQYLAKELNIDEKFASVSIEEIEKENPTAHM